jgi:hypothetical protein
MICSRECRKASTSARALLARRREFSSKILKELEHSPGGAKAGHASLMRPNRPLPTLPFADLPLRRNPNNAAAVIAAFVTRGHCTSLGLIARITPTSDPAHNPNLGE